jgi:hypothetical protein
MSSSATDLSEKTSSTTSSEVDVHVVVLSVYGLLNERLLDDMTIDNNGISIVTQNDLFASRDLAVLLIPIAVSSSALHPALGDIRRAPGIFTLAEGSWKNESDIPPDPLSKSSIHTRSSISGHFGSGGSRYTDMIQDGKHESSVPEQSLHGERVDTDRRRSGRVGKLRIGDGLRKREIGRKERD